MSAMPANNSSKRLSTAAASAGADLSLPIRAIDGHGRDSVADGNGPTVSEGGALDGSAPTTRATRKGPQWNTPGG
jgi:hypothetical protein